MLMTEELAVIDPSVTPCWRWQTAQKLARDPSLVTQSDDPLIQEAATYLRTGDERCFLILHSARQIFEEDGLRRAEMEARILAKQSDAEIAESCHVSPQLVALYHDMFFWVRSYLKTDWCIHHTIGNGRHTGFTNQELRQLWAKYALAGGPVVVDELVRSYRSAAQPDDPVELSIYLRADSEVRRDLQVNIAFDVLPQHGAGRAWSLEIGARQRELRAITDQQRREVAFHSLQGIVIDLGRKVLAGVLLPCPSHRKPLKQRSSNQKRNVAKLTPADILRFITKSGHSYP